MTNISVLVADDEPIVCSGMALLLSMQPDITVVGQAHTGDEAVRLTRSLMPDVVVLDIRMPGIDGVAATRLLTETPEPSAHLPRVLIVTTFPDDHAVYGSLRAGASGFLLKYAAPSDLVAAVRRVAAGDAWIDPTVAPRVIAALTAIPGHGNPAPELVARLTPRERQVLTLMAHGMDNTVLSRRLVLSEATVKTHVSRILMKTSCRDRAAAVAVAYQSGLVRPGQGLGDLDQNVTTWVARDA